MNKAETQELKNLTAPNPFNIEQSQIKVGFCTERKPRHGFSFRCSYYLVKCPISTIENICNIDLELAAGTFNPIASGTLTKTPIFE